ncbi:MAG: shikimate dehydrogenase, partial [Rhodospirillaceae bacterium]|nr:shikimate dehydrogenase [Rhodospirillaceae bacterium]
FVGANITVPHKEAALKIVDETDEMAARIGAVNTIVVKDNGKLFGLNTDGFGFIENLKAGAPDFDFTKSPAVVLGAGGAARSVVGALLGAGTPEVRIINRSGARAEALAMDLVPHWDGDIAIVPWDHRAAALTEAGLLVNTTTLGMKGQPELEISLDRLDPGAVVNDIVYNPLETKLLKNAKERGNVVVDGIGMLLHQARPGFKLWFGVDAKVSDELRAHVLQALKGSK